MGDWTWLDWLAVVLMSGITMRWMVLERRVRLIGAASWKLYTACRANGIRVECDSVEFKEEATDGQ